MVPAMEKLSSVPFSSSTVPEYLPVFVDVPALTVMVFTFMGWAVVMSWFSLFWHPVIIMAENNAVVKILVFISLLDRFSIVFLRKRIMFRLIVVNSYFHKSVLILMFRGRLAFWNSML